MKNIHLLPTDKPSKLFITEGKIFKYHKPQEGDGVKIINQNIYITSDEEIKEGDWVLFSDRNSLYKVEYTSQCFDLNYYEDCKKIVLTNNNTLIENNVQEVDDDFLRWLVKNPTCEFVRIGKGYFKNDYEQSLKIIIPKEELNQETLEEASERILLGEDLDLSDYDKRHILKAMVNIAKWQQEHEQFFNDDRVKTLEKSMEYLLKRQKTMFSGDEVYDILTHHTVELFKKEPITLEDFWNKFKK